jgi:hypothetical protein
MSANHRKQSYFMLEEMDADWFDSIRSAITINNSTLAIATPWYSEYNKVTSNGILPIGLNQCSWHSTEIVGWKLIQGATYLICKSHQGNTIGDNGYVYFSRDEINRIMNISGSCGGIIAKNFSNNIATIKTAWTEFITGLYLEVVYFFSNLGNTPKTVAQAPLKAVLSQVTPVTYPLATVNNFCKAISEYEGNGPTDRATRNNNPGDCRYHSSMGITVTQDKNGFAVFPTYADGWNYLIAKITNCVKGLSTTYPQTFTILQFFNVYSPTLDSNDPQRYSIFVSAKLGVTNSYIMKDLIV